MADGHWPTEADLKELLARHFATPISSPDELSTAIARDIIAGLGTRHAPAVGDLRDTFCFLESHDHDPEDPCPNDLKAKRVAQALQARYDWHYGR